MGWRQRRALRAVSAGSEPLRWIFRRRLEQIETIPVLYSTVEPFRIFLSCYHVLCANEDPRASALLRTAYDLLQEQAARIHDPELRRSFLENVVAHREIVALHAQRQ